jgi:SAM-dependent methyltransferase
VAQRVDFSANAPIYDRRHGVVLEPSAARQLALAADLLPDDRVLEIGAGTGRVAIAFAAIGCHTVALDPALAMLHGLRRKSPESGVHVVAAEGARLPFTDGSFDGVILARILYLMSDWETVVQRALEVLKPGGSLLHEWGNGQGSEEWVQIREKARTLFQQAGVDQPFHPGARSEDEVDRYMVRLGSERRNELPMGPGPGMTLREFVGRIASGELSYIWSIPKPVQELCLPQLQEWCERSFDLERAAPIPQELHWTIYRKP